MSNKDFETFFEQYLDTLLWCTAVDDENGGMCHLDYDYTINDINSESMKELRHYAEDFYSKAVDLFNQTPESYRIAQAGHDFALTSNRHGAGYWDRGLGDIGDKLTELSESYSVDLYIGDNNELYV